MILRTWNNEDIARGTSVLVRVDFHALSRISAAVPEILRLLRRGARITLATHADASTRSLIGPVAAALRREVIFVGKIWEPVGAARVARLPAGTIGLAENLRAHPGEMQDARAFARLLAAPFSVVIHNAFGVVHRRHASVHALARELPMFAGELLVREMAVLTAPTPMPSLAIIGGAKVATKFPLINGMLNRADRVAVMGRIALPLLCAQATPLPRSLRHDVRWRDVLVARRLLQRAGDRLLLPTDLLICDDTLVDVGDASIVALTEAIHHAATVWWSGPLGDIHHEHGTTATRAIAQELSIARPEVCIVGGGDTVTFLEEEHLLAAATHISTGGGAMDAVLAGAPLPGMTAVCMRE